MTPVAPGILVETEARGQPLPGAACVAMIGDMRWDFASPSVITIGAARGVLRIVCNQTGYRSSELLFKPAAGYARYPKRLVLEMNQP